MATLGVFLDGNVWNFLFERRLDLAVELPRPEFGICHTREAEFEIPTGKPDLNAYIEATIERCEIVTDSFFGFFNPDIPGNEQRYGGFDVGRFARHEEIAFISAQRKSLAQRPTKLQKHEADISLAARSFHSVVLTLDKRSSALRDARSQGGKVVYLNGFDDSGISLAEFIRSAIK